MPTRPDPHVLVADHEPAVLGLITAALTRAGYRVTAVRGLRQGAELLADPAHTFAAAILPDRSSGPSVRDFLAARPGCTGLPVVVTAASVQPATAAAVAADPNALLLPKPFRPDEVVRVLAELLTGDGPVPRGPFWPAPPG